MTVAHTSLPSRFPRLDHLVGRRELCNSSECSIGTPLLSPPVCPPPHTNILICPQSTRYSQGVEEAQSALQHSHRHPSRPGSSSHRERRFDYLVAGHFRTVLQECGHVQGGSYFGAYGASQSIASSRTCFGRELIGMVFVMRDKVY